MPPHSENDNALVQMRRLGQLPIPQAAPVVLAAVYLAGFVVINAHLGKHGVVAVDLASLRYLSAGTLFCAFLVIWYLFPGRTLLLSTERLAKAIAITRNAGLAPGWAHMAYVNWAVKMLFMTCLSAVLFATIPMGRTETGPFSFYLLILFLVAYPWDVLDCDVRYPRANIIFELFTRVTGGLIFAATVGLGSPTTMLFFSFCVLSMFAALVMDSFERFKITGDLLTYNMIYSIVFVFLFSASFGRLHYEDVKSAFGGGEHQAVEIIINDQVAWEGFEGMGFASRPVLIGELVHESQGELIVYAEEHVLKLPKRIVAGIRVVPVEDANWFRRFLGASQEK